MPCPRRDLLRFALGLPLAPALFGRPARAAEGPTGTCDELAHTAHGGWVTTSRSGAPPAPRDELKPFVDEMRAHCHQFAPHLAEAMGERALEQHIRTTVSRGAAWGFTLRGPLRTLLEMTFLFGTDFDTDPQYPWAAEILHRDAPEMERAEALYQRILVYQDAVTAWAHRRALFRWLWSPPRLDAVQTEAGLVAEMTRLFPEKAEHLGAEPLKALAREAVTESDRRGLSDPEGRAIVTGLMFALGHGCARDPLLPMVTEHVEEIAHLPPERRSGRAREHVLRWTARLAT